MPSNKISQREARQWRKRALGAEQVLANQKTRWNKEWGLGWVNFATLNVGEVTYGKIATARLLRHAVIVVPDDGFTVRFIAESL